MPKARARKDNKGRILNKGEGYRDDKALYYYNYRTPDGKKHVAYARTLKELREREKEIARKTMEGLDTYVAGKATLNYMVDRYLDTKKTLRESTLVNYRYTYDHWVRDTDLGKRPIGEIRYSDVKLFYLGLLEEKDMEISTVGNIHTVLHPAFDMAVRDDIIRKNPSDHVMGEIKKLIGRKRSKRHALTLEQQRAFLNYLKDNPVYGHWYPLFIFMFGTGCRIGEVSGLKWTDLDYDKRMIRIERSIVYRPNLRGVCERHISLTKTEKSERTIPMLDHVYTAMQAEYLKQKKTGFCEEVIDGEDGFVFRNKDKQALLAGPVNRAIKRITDAYNAKEEIDAVREKREPVLIPDFSCHVIRHTFCTRMCEGDINIKALQDIMGHADIQTTLDIYAEVGEGKRTEFMKALEHEDKVF